MSCTPVPASARKGPTTSCARRLSRNNTRNIALGGAVPVAVAIFRPPATPVTALPLVDRVTQVTDSPGTAEQRASTGSLRSSGETERMRPRDNAVSVGEWVRQHRLRSG